MNRTVAVVVLIAIAIVIGVAIVALFTGASPTVSKPAGQSPVSARLVHFAPRV